MNIGLRIDRHHQRHDILEVGIELPVLVKPPERNRGIDRFLRLERQHREFRMREGAGEIAEAAPGDLRHVVLDAIVEIRRIDDAHPVADIEMQHALADLVDVLGPGMKDPHRNMRAGGPIGREDQRRLFGLRRAGPGKPRRQNPGRPAAHRTASLCFLLPFLTCRAAR